ncbi:hypothetical protein P5G61_02945 [Paenibacillus sp. F6_3S_P_1C]|uniref:Uncharacterized protein n=1 Tax=Paenibacillus vandeheii TaxID=3035917 RepID=A0ABT8J520_9BACL|nr:hypothetical protein [Paenibacillus vandeheii]MDN4600171.1 hypothetical protein [Paenibacillus vandeheii]
MSIIIPDGQDETALMERQWKGDGIEEVREVCSSRLFSIIFVSAFSEM